MKYIKGFLFYVIIVVVHFLIQSVMLLVSITSKLIFFEEPLWSLGGMITHISAILYQILSFPLILMFQKLGIHFTEFPDLPFILSSFLWGLMISILHSKRKKRKRRTRYQFVRGI